MSNVPLAGGTRNRIAVGDTGWSKPSPSVSTATEKTHRVNILITGQNVDLMDMTYIVCSLAEGNTLSKNHVLYHGYQVLTMQHESPASGHGEPGEQLQRAR